jgi:hypothetical protein
MGFTCNAPCAAQSPNRSLAGCGPTTDLVQLVDLLEHLLLGHARLVSELLHNLRHLARRQELVQGWIQEPDRHLRQPTELDHSLVVCILMTLSVRFDIGHETQR